MQHKLDNLLCSKGFIPNSCNKVSKYLNLEGNPFTRLANITDDVHRITVSMNSKLLYYKMINCDSHRITALMLNVNISNNYFRLLEILYHYLFVIYGKHLKLWDKIIIELNESFHKGIKNQITGESKVKSLTYSIFKNILSFMNDNIEREFILLQKNDISFQNIWDLFLSIIVLFPVKECTCNDYITYPLEFLKTFCTKNNIENILNNVPINYEYINFEQQYINNINQELKPKIPQPKNLCNIRLPYDFLPELERIDFIQSTIRNNDMLDKIYNIKNETYNVFRSFNKCFICDIDITEIIYDIHIKNGSVHEQISKKKSNIIYPIINRCLICRKKSYCKVLETNYDCIMARHYKWMVFYLGNQKSLLYLHKEILWLIIMKYLEIRCI